MEEGESIVRADGDIQGAHGKTILVVSTRAFYLRVAGRYVRHPYRQVKSITVDTHDVFVALPGRVVRFSVPRGTAQSQAVQSLKVQVAMRSSAA